MVASNPSVEHVSKHVDGGSSIRGNCLAAAAPRAGTLRVAVGEVPVRSIVTGPASRSIPPPAERDAAEITYRE